MTRLKKDINITWGDTEEIFENLSNDEIMELISTRNNLTIISSKNNEQQSEIEEFIEQQKKKWG